MLVPDCLATLVDLGTIQEVVRPLLSGKEAQIYLVVAGGEQRVAKVYKDADNRSFKHRTEYLEARRVRNTRDQRAMNKGTRYGRAKQEEAWRSTEFDIICRLRAAGVHVPRPFDFVENVLVMELIRDAAGNPAPRLADVEMQAGEAFALLHRLLRDVVRMLRTGVVHGDLSDFNVLMSAQGPVLIDFPQAVDPTQNQSARRLLVRDVANLTRSLGRFAPKLNGTRFGEEMWAYYERNELNDETHLTGRYRPSQQKADTNSLLEEIAALEREARQRRERLGLPPVRPARQPRFAAAPAPAAAAPRPKWTGHHRQPRVHSRPESPRGPDQQRRSGSNASGPPPQSARVATPNATQNVGATGQAPRRRHRRRRRRGGAGPKPQS